MEFHRIVFSSPIESAFRCAIWLSRSIRSFDSQMWLHFIRASRIEWQNRGRYSNHLPFSQRLQLFDWMRWIEWRKLSLRKNTQWCPHFVTFVWNENRLDFGGSAREIWIQSLQCGQTTLCWLRYHYAHRVLHHWSSFLARIAIRLYVWCECGVHIGLLHEMIGMADDILSSSPRRQWRLPQVGDIDIKWNRKI